jgi:hypothetical protein
MTLRHSSHFGRLVILLFTLFASVSSQEVSKPRPNFSGIWIDGETTLKIKIEGPKLTIKRSSRTKEAFLVYGVRQHFTESYEMVYYMDGRGETQKTSKAKSTTKWEGDKLVVRTSSIRTSEGDTLEIDVTDTWEVSKDGSELMLSSVYRSSDKTTTVHQLFAREKP